MIVTARRVMLLGSLTLALAASLPARTATACEMFVVPIQVGPARADALLATARERMDQGRWSEAAALVRRVAASRLARPAQRAEALAVLGWSAWRQGRRAALPSFRKARSLDGAAVESVLARTRAPEQVTALRAALAG
jgi:hypothetical protein